MLETQKTFRKKEGKMAKTKCIEKDLLERGLLSEFEYKTNYEGASPLRSEARLYGLYEAVADILKHAGKKDVKAQGVGGCKKSDLTVTYIGNTYGSFTSNTQVSPDIVFRNSDGLSGQINGVEIRAGSASLEKNIYNNSRALTGEEAHYNHIIRKNSNIDGNYFTIIAFVNIDNKDFTKVVGSMLHLHEIGKRVALVPFKMINDLPEVLLGVVPSQIQLMRVLREV